MELLFAPDHCGQGAFRDLASNTGIVPVSNNETKCFSLTTTQKCSVEISHIIAVVSVDQWTRLSAAVY